MLLAVRADLVAHFELDEGADNPSTLGILSSVGGWSAVLFGPRAWSTNELADVPEGTRAALLFNASNLGIDPYAVTDYRGIEGGGARTVAAWVRGVLPQPNLGVLVSWGRNERASRFTVRFDTALGENEGQLRLEASGQAVIGETVVLEGQWHHVAVVTPAGGSTHDSALYVDGVSQRLTRLGTAVPLNTQVSSAAQDEWVYLGNGGWSPESYGFNGALDDVRIYNEALTEAQVRELASIAGTPPEWFGTFADQSYVLGDPAARVTFRATVTGRAPLTYEWRFRGEILPEHTGPNLTIQPTGSAAVGAYQVRASNSFGFVNGSAQLRLVTGPVEPTKQTALVGGSATFSVRMPTVEGYQYQWEKEGNAIEGATGPQLIRTDLKASDAGVYRVRVTLGTSTVVSDAVVLQVVSTLLAAYPATVIRDGAEAYWRLGETNGSTVALDLLGRHNATYVNYSGAELGIPGALREDPDTASLFVPPQFNYVERVLSPELKDVRAFTVEAWVKPVTSAESSLVTALSNLPSSGYQVSLIGAAARFRTGASLNPAGREFDDLVGGQVILGEWNHLVATYDGTIKRLYLSGYLVGEQTIFVLPSPGALFRLGAGNGSGLVPGTILSGAMDEVAFYRRALDPLGIITHYLTAARSPGRALVLYHSGSVLNLLWADSKRILESADLPEGPWELVAGAVSPHRVVPQEEQLWFRLR